MNETYVIEPKNNGENMRSVATVISHNGALIIIRAMLMDNSIKKSAKIL
jgi:hypothetical protein